MKRIQNSIDCVLVLSRRHTVYCTVRGHKTLTLNQKKEKKKKTAFGRQTFQQSLTIKTLCLAYKNKTWHQSGIPNQAH